MSQPPRHQKFGNALRLKKGNMLAISSASLLCPKVFQEVLQSNCTAGYHVVQVVLRGQLNIQLFTGGSNVFL